MERYDVVIIGGGLAGLSAARKLKERGRSVVVLEARERVGGRCWTLSPELGGWVDNGAQWAGESHTEILRLAKELGIATYTGFPQRGKIIFVFKGERYELPGAADADEWSAYLKFFEQHFIHDFHDFLRVERELDRLAAEVPKEAPWSAPFAEQWDAMTVQGWMEGNELFRTEGARFLMRVFCLAYFASEPRDISFLHLLFYVAAGGGTENLMGTVRNRFVGGTQAIVEGLAGIVGEERIRLNSPVREIDQSGDEVVIKTDRESYRAAKVIIAVPAAIIAKIRFTPALPASRQQFIQRAPMGSSIKCHLVYERAFWQPAFSGVAMSDAHDVSFVTNNTPSTGGPAILGCFIDTRVVREVHDQSDEALKAIATRAIEALFAPSVGEVPKPDQVFIANWNAQSWSAGCYSAVLGPGVWTGFKNTLRQPAGRIHWASTETATEKFAYMDGAIRSGERAAEEI